MGRTQRWLGSEGLDESLPCLPAVPFIQMDLVLSLEMNSETPIISYRAFIDDRIPCERIATLPSTFCHQRIACAFV